MRLPPPFLLLRGGTSIARDTLRAFPFSERPAQVQLCPGNLDRCGAAKAGARSAVLRRTPSFLLLMGRTPGGPR